MKKIIVLIIAVIIVTGCSNKKEQELCNKIDEIDVDAYTEAENYQGLTELLENYNSTYCSEIDSEVCEKLDEYIDASKKEVDQSFILADLEKQMDVINYHEEISNICRDLET